jgi:hypothetical protein
MDINKIPESYQVTGAVNELFATDVKTTSDRILLNTCKISGVSAFSGQLIVPFINKLHGLPQKIVIVCLAISALTFIATLCLLGIRSVGRAAGKRTLFMQTYYVLARVTLYVLLPCIVVTLLIILWAVATKQPAFR